MNIKTTLLLMVLGSQIVWGYSVRDQRCQAYIEKLYQMQMAQVSLLNDLNQRHETFAVTLDSYADTYQNALLANKMITLKSIESMNVTANSFRLASVESRKVIEQFTKASEKLIKNVEKFLSQTVRKSKK